MTEHRSIPFGRPWIDDEDRRAVWEVLQGHILTHGPKCHEFEQRFASFMGDGVHCVSVSSGMAALHLAYFHLGIGPGDEVLVPAQTHTATAHAVEMVGARPVFIDCDLATGNIDPSQLEAHLTPRTKAISLVHFLGIPCDMDRIMAVANRHSLKVIEDCALAVAARYKGRHVGLIGDMGCFSFYPVKHITTGEGGMFVTRHRDVAESVARQRAFGVDRRHTERKIPGVYDVVELGLNYRMSEMQAALGCCQVDKVPEILRRRKVNFQRLKSALGTLSDVSVLDSTHPDMKNSHYCLSVLLHGSLRSRRNETVAMLNGAGVGTSIYYPQPVPRMTYYREKYGLAPSAYVNASIISDASIALPIGPHLSSEDIDYIGQTFQSILEAFSA